MSGVYCELLNSGRGFYAPGANFNPLAVYPGPLEVWQQADYTRPHGMGAFNGAAITFAANCALAWHIKIFRFKIKDFRF
jgi:hypothetical protein